MRIIAGTSRGRKLKAPPGLHTRPITDMIKEALFNVWGEGIVGANFLDLFAGSGSVGIEALSRGAAKAIFIDNDPAAVRIIRENLAHCGFKEGFGVYRQDVFRALNMLNDKREKFDYIYVDPPFTNDQIFDNILTAINNIDIISRFGIVVIRTQKNRNMADKLDKLERYRTNVYGESCLHYYRRYEEGPTI